MVKALLDWNPFPNDDAADALAIAICHCTAGKSPLSA